MKKSIILITLCLLALTISAVHAQTPVTDQLALIGNSRSLWIQEAFGLWGFTVTDLDRNGRLEIISASVQGTGFYTNIIAFEVNEAGNALVEVEQDRKEGDSAPDIMVDKAPMYFDETTGIRYYIFSDLIRNGYQESYENIRAVSLENGVWKEKPLAFKTTLFTDNSEGTSTYTNPAGESITRFQYQNAAEEAFAPLKAEEFRMNWQMTDTEAFNAMSPADLTAALTSAVK